MNAYRIDVIFVIDSRLVTLERRYFEASSDDQAAAEAQRTVAQHVASPDWAESVYGELWRGEPGSIQAGSVGLVWHKASGVIR